MKLALVRRMRGFNRTLRKAFLEKLNDQLYSLFMYLNMPFLGVALNFLNVNGELRLNIT